MHLNSTRISLNMCKNLVLHNHGAYTPSPCTAAYLLRPPRRLSRRQPAACSTGTKPPYLSTAKHLPSSCTLADLSGNVFSARGGHSHHNPTHPAPNTGQRGPFFVVPLNPDGSRQFSLSQPCLVQLRHTASSISVCSSRSSSRLSLRRSSSLARISHRRPEDEIRTTHLHEINFPSYFRLGNGGHTIREQKGIAISLVQDKQRCLI